jgi:hypothetical protein
MAHRSISIGEKINQQKQTVVRAKDKFGGIEVNDSISFSMTELVLYADRWVNLNGNQRTMPWRIPRKSFSRQKNT